MNKNCKSETCEEVNPQPAASFVKDSRYKDGYQNRCKSCQKKHDSERFNNKREEILQQSKTYYVSNLETARAKRAEWRENHKEYMVEYGKLYRQFNPGKELAKTRRYKLAKIQAVPSWLTKEQIQEMQMIYETCPDGFEVDHIVPIQGKNVKGLHVPWNLRHLSRAENRKKSNKY